MPSYRVDKRRRGNLESDNANRRHNGQDCRQTVEDPFARGTWIFRSCIAWCIRCRPHHSGSTIIRNRKTRPMKLWANVSTRSKLRASPGNSPSGSMMPTSSTITGAMIAPHIPPAPNSPQNTFIRTFWVWINHPGLLTRTGQHTE